MISNVLKVGDRIELKRFSLANEENQTVKPRLYQSQLLDITDSSRISIAVPLESGHLVPLDVGGRYELRFITANGIYICKGEITNRYKSNNIYFLAVHVLSDLRKDQRRQYFRLDKVRDLKYHLLTGDETELIRKLAAKDFKDDREKRVIQNELAEFRTEESPGTLANISGGGIKFHSDLPLERDAVIRIQLLLDDADPAPLDLFARVVSSEKTINKNLKYEHRMEFVNISRDVREHIVKYVFNEERKQRQRE